MGILCSLRCPTRWLAPLVLFGALATSSPAAVTVSDVSVALSGGNAVLTYRLNRPATTVTVQVGSQTVNGPVASGLNSVNLPLSAVGQPATITVTAPAESGTGGATVLVPFTQDPSSNRITGIDTVDRPGSPVRDRIFVAAGFAQAGQKKLFQYASDGSLLLTKDLNAIITSGSWPFGLAVAQEDPNDFVYVANRTARNIVKFNPLDLSVASTILTVTNNYLGMSVTPNNIEFNEDPWSIYLSGNRDGSVWHRTYDGDVTVNVPAEPLPANNTAGSVYHGQAAAVDPTNAVMFKVQTLDTFNTPDGPIGAINGTDANNAALYNIQKWTSTNGGDSWVQDTAWTDAFRAGVGTDETAAAMGVALDRGFSAANLAASRVWVSVASAAGVNKLYHVNAATGAVIAADTIDLTQITEPAGTRDIANHPAHFLAVDRQGNIALTVNDPAFMSAPRNDLSTNANFWGVLAPNTAGPTTDVLNIASLQPVLSFTVTSSRPSIGNTGLVSTTITAVVSDPGGQAGSATVTGDLTSIGGPAALALSRVSQSPDNRQATFSATYTIPNTALAGNYDLPFTMTIGGETRNATLAQGVYNALIPVWTQALDGPVNSSPASSGTTAYIGTDAGSVYALNAASGGAPIPAFGGSGKVSLGEPIRGRLLASEGRLYATGSNHVFALDIGTGALLGTSPLIPSPHIALNPVVAPGFVFVGGGDGRLYKLNAANLSQAAVSANLGAAVNTPGVGPSAAEFDGIVVAGTESGSIVALKATDLSPVFANAVIQTDPAGAVRGNPVFLQTPTSVLLGIGGASGFWGINPDTGEKLGNGTDSWGTIAAQMGNPYVMDSPVDAYATSGAVGEASVPGFVFASTGDATSGGQINIISGASGQRVSFGGLPIPLTPTGSGVSRLGGPLYLTGTNAAAEASRRIYIGSDETDQRFFAVESAPQDFTYGYTPAKVAIFDPQDTATFPNSVAGAFNSAPAVADGVVVAGSSSGRVYGFPLLIADLIPYVTSVTPANGASGVPANQTVTVAFNKAFDPLNITGQNVLLMVDGQPVAATVTPAGDNLSLTIAPSSALQANKTYAVVVGPALAQPFTSTFYTGTLPPNRADAVRALQIAGGLAAATAADVQRLDTNGDQAITLIDATRITRQLNGL